MDKVKDILKVLTPKVLASAKAVVGFVIGSLVAYLAKNGIELPTETVQALQAGIYGIIVAIWVWWIPNKAQ